MDCDHRWQQLLRRNSCLKPLLHGPITTTQDQSEPTSFDSDTDLSKRKLFAEYYHNNEKFKILLLNNPECDWAQSCMYVN